MTIATIKSENSESKFIKLRKFETIEEMNGSVVSSDYENNVVKIEWSELVDLEVARRLLNVGADLIEQGHCDKLLLNRKNLKEFTTEARLWIKQDLLLNRGKKLVGKVIKVATVNSNSARGGVFANFINAGIQLVFPQLKLSKFDNEHSAINWLLKNG